jgi:hypothetical protein
MRKKKKRMRKHEPEVKLVDIHLNHSSFSVTEEPSHAKRSLPRRLLGLFTGYLRRKAAPRRRDE